MSDAPAERLRRLRAALAAADVEALVVSGRANVRYLSGFGGSAGLCWVARDDAALLTDFRYWEQAAREAPDWRLQRQEPGTEIVDTLQGVCRLAGVRRVGFESTHLSVADHLVWRERLGATLVPLSGTVERLRAVKDAGEIGAIARAAELADAALEAVVAELRPGVAEVDVAIAFEAEARHRGAQSLAFPTIVASGPNGSLPHAVPGWRRLAPGDLVTVDYGVVLDGYCSDSTRTYALGEPGAEARSVHRLVLEALAAGLDTIRPGARCADVDGAARRVIAAAGRGDQFGHGLGHGVGVEVHESPRLSPSAGDAVLAGGMVVTVEPGIYVPGRLGVRVEELAVVEPSGPRLLTRSRGDLLLR